MIKLSNGYNFEFACGSGALAFDGRGWPWEYPLRWLGLIRPDQITVVAKTITLQPRKGNLVWYKPWTCVRLLGDNSAVNAISLTNPGFDRWLEKHYPVAVKKGYNLAVSIQLEDEGVLELAKRLAALDLLVYVEVNASCPNVQSHADIQSVAELLAEIKRLCGHPLIIKISYAQAMNPAFIAMLDARRSVEAIHAINTIPWKGVYPHTASPIVKYVQMDGGVSGMAIRNEAIEAVHLISERTDLPIVGGGGIMDIDDVKEFSDAGASAFSLGTVFLVRPWRPRNIIRNWPRFCNQEKLELLAKKLKVSTIKVET